MILFGYLLVAHCSLLIAAVIGGVAELVEGSRLLSGCGGNTPPRVRIPTPPPEKAAASKEQTADSNTKSKKKHQKDEGSNEQ